MAFRFQLRRDTALVWSAVDPVLLIGELAYETDTNRMKIGDGATPWNDLPYFLDSVYSVNGQAGYVMLYTDDIPEGATAINKWYSNDLVADLLQAGDGVTLDYNATGGTLTISASGSLSLPGDGLLSLTPSPIQDVDGVKSSLYLATESIGVSGNLGVGTLDPSAIVQIDSTTSGLVIPRMTETQKNAIAGPTGGMIIYQTDGVEGVYQYKASTGWESIDPGDISGTINYVSKFTSGNVIGDSSIYDNGITVNIGGTASDPSAKLQITSTSQGFLGPKMSQVDRNSIVGPTAGLLVYNTTTDKLNIWDGSKWSPAGGGLKLIGDSDLQQQPLQVQDAADNGSTFYLGATAQGFLGPVGIGTTGPKSILEIQSTTSGLVLPRMTQAQRNALSPIVGMVIYQTDGIEGAYQYRSTGGGTWDPIDPGDITGTVGYISKFTGTNTISDSLMYDSGSVISIGTTGATASAIFQVDSTTKGVLIPRVTEAQRISIASPADGLLVTETGPTGGLNQYIDSIGWVQYVHNNGGVTGGTQYIYGDLTIYGTLSATAKSFFIDNPKKPGEKLIYGVSEAPEHSVFYRGRSSDKIIKLPEEWEWLVDDNTITVQLTCIGKSLPLVVDSIGSKEIGVKIDSWNPVINKSKLDYYYYIQAERKDIPKLKTK